MEGGGVSMDLELVWVLLYVVVVVVVLHSATFPTFVQFFSITSLDEFVWAGGGGAA